MDEKERDILMAEKIAAEVEAAGGHVYYVGGLVRDQLLGADNKDVDIEVHGITEETLVEILDKVGERLEMGASFGIYGLRHYDIDIAMPRTERKTGNLHTDFDVTTDPFIGTYAAAERRDFTINALMQDVISGEIIDYFNGVEDLKNGKIRHVNDKTFVEDPLRVLRAAQFAARFDFEVADETVELCRTISLEHLPSERIEGEMRKAFIKGRKPSVFFNMLRNMNQLDIWFPEIKQLIGLEQSMKYHKEGDVWTHTMMALDAAAGFRNRAEEPYAFMLSALAHDLGKIAATEFIKGDIHAYRHEELGLPIVDEFISRITRERSLKKYVLNMSEMHMQPNTMAANNVKVKSTNKMFDKAINPNDLIFLAIADGMSSDSEIPYVNPEKFLFERLEIFNELMSRPYVKGVDLIKAGLVPGEDFRWLLDYAHRLRLAGVKKEEALKQVLGVAGSTVEQ